VSRNRIGKGQGRLRAFALRRECGGIYDVALFQEDCRVRKMHGLCQRMCSITTRGEDGAKTKTWRSWWALSWSRKSRWRCRVDWRRRVKSLHLIGPPTHLRQCQSLLTTKQVNTCSKLYISRPYFIQIFYSLDFRVSFTPTLNKIACQKGIERSREFPSIRATNALPSLLRVFLTFRVYFRITLLRL
jgi:hypothetical protein